MIEGIVLNLPNQNEVRFNVRAFSKMKKLRILKIHNTSFVNISFSNLYHKLLNLHWHSADPLRFMPTHGLRVLEWSEYPSKSLSNSFQAGNLIELRFPCSHIKQLWKGISVRCFLLVLVSTTGTKLVNAFFVFLFNIYCFITEFWEFEML